MDRFVRQIPLLSSPLLLLVRRRVWTASSSSSISTIFFLVALGSGVSSSIGGPRNSSGPSAQGSLLIWFLAYRPSPISWGHCHSLLRRDHNFLLLKKRDFPGFKISPGGLDQSQIVWYIDGYCIPFFYWNAFSSPPNQCGRINEFLLANQADLRLWYLLLWLLRRTRPGASILLSCLHKAYT